MRPTRTCSHDECEGTVEARGLCHTHYMAWYRAQDAEIEGKVASLVDAYGKPEEWVCFWCSLYDDEDNVPAVAWFMNEAICKTHIKLAQRWTAFALRKL